MAFEEVVVVSLGLLAAWHLLKNKAGAAREPAGEESEKKMVHTPSL